MRFDPDKLPNGALAIAVLEELRQALRRLGDDPAYYYVDKKTMRELHKLNPALIDALNAWVADLNRCHVIDLSEAGDAVS